MAKTSKGWIDFDLRAPKRNCYIWIVIGRTQVKLAWWDMERECEYTHETGPGITWCQPWLGTEQPSHWMLADIPKSPFKNAGATS